MDKLLVRLLVPVVQNCFDLFVPRDMEITTLTALMVEGVETLYKGRFSTSEPAVLLQKDLNLVFDPSCTLMDYGVKDGTLLVLL